MWLVLVLSVFSGVATVLVPLRLDELGGSAFLVGAVFLCAAGFEAIFSKVSGVKSDQHGRLRPMRWGLIACAVYAVVLPLPDAIWLLAILGASLGVAFGFGFTPAIAQLSDRAESAGVPMAYAMGLVNLAWGGGQALGESGGGALAEATADAVTYGLVALALVVTVVVLRGRTDEQSSRLGSDELVHAGDVGLAGDVDRVRSGGPTQSDLVARVAEDPADAG